MRRAQVDDEIRLVEKAGAHDRIDRRRHRLLDRGNRDDLQAAGPRAARELHRNRGRTAGREDHHDIARPEREVVEDHLGEAGHPFDEHRLALAVGADDLGVEGHRQLDDRVEARVRTVAREHLLDRNPRMARPEQVDETVRGDRLGRPLARGLDRAGLGRGHLLEDGRRCGHPGQRRNARHGHRHLGVPVAVAGVAGAATRDSQWPLFIER